MWLLYMFYLLVIYNLEHGHAQFRPFVQGVPTTYIPDGLAQQFQCSPGFRLIVRDAGYTCFNFFGVRCTRPSCNSQLATKIITENCNCRSACRVQASRSLYGDPCPRFRKQAFIQYSCVRDQNFRCETSLTTASTTISRLTTRTTTTPRKTIRTITTPRITTRTRSTPRITTPRPTTRTTTTPRITTLTTTTSRIIARTMTTTTTTAVTTTVLLTTHAVLPTRTTTTEDTTTARKVSATTQLAAGLLSTIDNLSNTTSTIQMTPVSSAITVPSPTTKATSLTTTQTTILSTILHYTRASRTSPNATKRILSTTASDNKTSAIISSTINLNRSNILLTVLIPTIVVVVLLTVLTILMTYLCYKRKKAGKNSNLTTTDQSESYQNDNGHVLYQTFPSNNNRTMIDNELYELCERDRPKSDNIERYNRVRLFPDTNFKNQIGNRNDYNHIEITNNYPVTSDIKQSVYNELYVPQEFADHKNKLFTKLNYND